MKKQVSRHRMWRGQVTMGLHKQPGTAMPLHWPGIVINLAKWLIRLQNEEAYPGVKVPQKYGKSDCFRIVELRTREPANLSPIHSIHFHENRRMKKSDELSNAIAAGRLDRLRKLLTRGASPNVPDERGNLPLVLAIQAGNSEAVRLLVEAGAEVNPRVHYHCKLPIMIAFLSLNSEIFRVLLEHGAFPGPFTDGPFKGYVSAFYKAVHLGRRDIVRLLLAYGFEVDAPLETGLTPLMLAAREGHADLVGDFLDAGARWDQADDLGRTALSWAVAHNCEAYEWDRVDDECHEQVMTQLLSAGANPNQRDTHGRSVLSWATERGSQGIIELLTAYGAIY